MVRRLKSSDALLSLRAKIPKIRQYSSFHRSVKEAAKSSHYGTGKFYANPIRNACYGAAVALVAINNTIRNFCTPQLHRWWWWYCIGA